MTVELVLELKRANTHNRVMRHALKKIAQIADMIHDKDAADAIKDIVQVSLEELPSVDDLRQMVKDEEKH